MRCKLAVILIAFSLSVCSCAGMAEKDTEIMPEENSYQESSNKEKSDKEKETDSDSNKIEEISEYPKILTPTAEKIEFAYHSEGIFCIFTGEKYGFMKEDGNEITAYEYEVAYPFSENLACVMKGGKYGFIDKEGKEELPFIYDKANSFSEGLAYFEKGSNYGFINKEGEEVLSFECDSISSFKEGRAFFSIDGKYGFIDKEGKEVIPSIYDDVSYFQDGRSKVRQGRYTGVIDRNGEEVIPIKYDEAEQLENYVKTVKEEEENYFDYSGQKILPPDETKHEERASSIIRREEEKYGVVDEKGKTVIPFGKYNYIFPISDTVLCLVKDGKYYLAKNNGEKISEKFYDNIDKSAKGEGFYLFEENRQGGLLDASGKEVIPAIYADLSGSDAEIYHSNTACIATDYRATIRDKIIVMGEYQDINLSEILLTNEITPRIQPFHEQIQKEMSGAGNLDSIRTVKLFAADDFEKPLLYIHMRPTSTPGFPPSDSVFYRIENNQAKELSRGEECGGSMRGDYVQLYAEKETGKIIVGMAGSYGGFGGYASSNDLTQYENNEITKEDEFFWIGQASGNFSYEDDYLLENAQLFYDSEGASLNRENILEAEYMEKYSINDQIVSKEDYEKERKNYIKLSMNP